jgi:anti-sigma B factor antagonist
VRLNGDSPAAAMTDTHRIALAPELTIAHASATHAVLLEAAAHGGALEIDLAAVTDFDSSAVQLLLATRRHFEAEGRTLTLARPSAAVRDALATFGLQARFAPA